MDINSEIKMIVEQFEKEHIIDKNGLVKLLAYEDASLICSAADRVRKKFVGDDVHLRGLIEISNYCCKTCFYCGLRAANNQVQRYRMEAQEIIDCAKYAVSCGLKTIVIQGGEDKTFLIKDLCEIVNQIKSMGVAITLSIGELSTNDYIDLKSAGADRYLLRIETTNEELYERIHPGMSFKNRVRCLYDLKELGYETGTGCLIGLPGQTVEMLAEDLLFFKRIDADMLGMGPFIPCEYTPLENEQGGNVDMVLKMMALARLMMPDINMPATTALGVRDYDGYKKGLCCGANVIMPNIGINEYKRLYSIYPGKSERIGNRESQLESVKSMIIAQGRSIGQDFGYRKKL